MRCCEQEGGGGKTGNGSTKREECILTRLAGIASAWDCESRSTEHSQDTFGPTDEPDFPMPIASPFPPAAVHPAALPFARGSRGVFFPFRFYHASGSHFDVRRSPSFWNVQTSPRSRIAPGSSILRMQVHTAGNSETNFSDASPSGLHAPTRLRQESHRRMTSIQRMLADGN